VTVSTSKARQQAKLDKLRAKIAAREAAAGLEKLVKKKSQAI